MRITLACFVSVCALASAACDFDSLEWPDWEVGVPDPDAGTNPPEEGVGTPPTGWIGSPCASDADCTFDGGFCLDADDGFEDGMCSQRCDRYCPDEDGYPVTFCTYSEAASDDVCHSRCDFGTFPGVGCRTGYACETRPRTSELDVEVGTCVPETDAGAAPSPVTESECIQWLIDYNVDFELAAYPPQRPDENPELLCTLDDPVRLSSTVRGVRYRSSGDSYPDMLISCPMARALVLASEVMAQYDIDEVRHYGTTNCRTIGGTDRISQHGLGRAIDIATLYGSDGTIYDVEDHWEHDTPTPRSARAQVLYELAYEWHDLGIFNTILTPNYNDAHDNHFHLDLQEGASFIRQTAGHTHIGPTEHGD